MLEDALEREAEKIGKTYFEQLAEWCFKNPKLAIAVLKKFIPDKLHTEIEEAEPIKITVEHIARDGKPIEELNKNGGK